MKFLVLLVLVAVCLAYPLRLGMEDAALSSLPDTAELLQPEDPVPHISSQPEPQMPSHPADSKPRISSQQVEPDLYMSLQPTDPEPHMLSQPVDPEPRVILQLVTELNMSLQPVVPELIQPTIQPTRDFLMTSVLELLCLGRKFFEDTVLSRKSVHTSEASIPRPDPEFQMTLQSSDTESQMTSQLAPELKRASLLPWVEELTTPKNQPTRDFLKLQPSVLELLCLGRKFFEDTVLSRKSVHLPETSFPRQDSESQMTLQPSDQDPCILQLVPELIQPTKQPTRDFTQVMPSVLELLFLGRKFFEDTVLSNKSVYHYEASFRSAEF